MKYYLAYGPNLNLVQMRQRCPNARVVGYTYLFGARLVFRGSKNGCFLTTDFQQPWCPSMVGCGVYEISDMSITQGTKLHKLITLGLLGFLLFCCFYGKLRYK